PLHSFPTRRSSDLGADGHRPKSEATVGRPVLDLVERAGPSAVVTKAAELTDRALPALGSGDRISERDGGRRANRVRDARIALEPELAVRAVDGEMADGVVAPSRGELAQAVALGPARARRDHRPQQHQE